MIDPTEKPDRGVIRNCAFAFKCPKRWDELEHGRQPTERHCDACERTVYLCRTYQALGQRVAAGHCVAVDIDDEEQDEIVRTVGVVEPPYEY